VKLDKTHAFDLADRVRKTANALGDYRMKNWHELSGMQRLELERLEWQLLAMSTQVVTAAVGVSLDEADLSLSQLKGASNKAKKAFKTLQDVRKVIRVATAMVGLVAAGISQNPQAIASNLGAVVEAAAA